MESMLKNVDEVEEEMKPVSAEEAKKAIEADKKMRLEGYVKALNEAGKRFRCGIVAVAGIDAEGRIKTQLQYQVGE